MLGKLLKHEFRATGRTMLPIYGAVIVLSVLASISGRMMDQKIGSFLYILFGLIIAAFVIGVIAAVIMTAVMMIKRFYTNYLKDEGYLMHTLPVSVHALVWSKMLVSVVWFAATFVVIGLVMLLMVFIESDTNLAEIIAKLPSWKTIRLALAVQGIRMSDLWLLAAEALLAAIVGGLFTCLHFYAAMSLGHMFSRDKILLSIVFYVAISFVLSMATTGYGVGRMTVFENMDITIDNARQAVSFAKAVLGEVLLVQTVQAALLYLVTVLSLKKGLNLA